MATGVGDIGSVTWNQSGDSVTHGSKEPEKECKLTGIGCCGAIGECAEANGVVVKSESGAEGFACVCGFESINKWGEVAVKDGGAVAFGPCFAVGFVEYADHGVAAW